METKSGNFGSVESNFTNINDSNNISNNKNRETFFGYYVKNFRNFLSVFKGRSGRKEYISCIMFGLLITVFYYFLSFFTLFISESAIFLAVFLMFTECIASTFSLLFFIIYIRRLHDLGVSARVYFLVLVIITTLSLIFYNYSGFVKGMLAIAILLIALFNLLYMTCVKGKDYPNIYGAPIK